MTNINDVFLKLGLDTSNGLFITDDNIWITQTDFPNRVKRLIERKIKPYAFFCFDNKPLILFFINPSNKQELFKEIWNFNESPVIFILENDIIEIFNGFKYIKDEYSLDKFGGIEKLTDFSYFELVTGRTWEQYQQQLIFKNRVDYRLLENIKWARKLIVNDNGLDAKIANAIIGKSIFVRYLIDRKVKINFDGTSRIWTNNEFCELLDEPEKIKLFFDNLEDEEKGFNGDLFPLSSKDYSKISKNNFNVLRRLLQAEDIDKHQLSLFDIYDFSIIPIEFISNVYEMFIGKDNQRNKGAYYTPLFLVDYILKETVEKKLSSQNPKILLEDDRDGNILDVNDTIPLSCKVLDPACGSGIFLVETLRKIIEKYILDSGIDIKSDRFKEKIKEIAKQNLYGVDRDLSAIQVAIFSIYLTLLDYLDPPEIETFKFPFLLNSNFFESDFFDETAPFNNQLKDVQFDFIMGNPPWMRGKGEKIKPEYVNYINRRKEREKNIPQIDIGNREIAQAFVLRSSDFCKKNTEIALIVTSKALYNLQSASFRKYFLHHYLINKVFELASVRHEVFEKSNVPAIAPAAILFYQFANGENTDNSIIKHISLKKSRFFSMFKIFTISRNDYKEIQQKKLKEFDWLWKVLVYGSYLDFNFIKRLYFDCKTIGDIIIDESLLFKQGLKRKDGNKKIQVKELIGKPFLDTKKGALKPFQIFDTGQKWMQETIGYIYQENGKPYFELFKPYSLLITGGISNDFKSNAAISHDERVFTSSVRAVKAFNSSKLPILYSINSIICSSLFAYYMVNIGASAGIEREESEDEEIKNMWYISSQDIINAAIKIEIENKDDNFFKIIKPVNQTIDPIIFKEFKLSDVEKDLIAFATDISIPIAMRQDGYEKLFNPISFEKQPLIDYATLFINRFESKLDPKKKFIVEIWHTQQIIGMFFKLVPISEYKESIVWINKENNDLEILSFLIQISSKKITDRLFVQKDIRGFEKDYFYIFKPNETRLWHKAIGHLDVNEFADAILKARRDS